MVSVTREEYQQAEDIEGLANTLLERDGDVDEELSVEDVYEQARENWWELTRTDDNGVSAELPGYDIETDKGTIHVRGVVHGVSKRFVPAPDDAVDMLNTEITEQCEYGPVLLESGFKDMLLDDVNNNQEAVEEVGGVDWASQQNPFGLLKYAVKETAKLPIQIPTMKIAPFISEHTNNRKWDYLTALNGSLSSVENWDDALNAMDAYHLPLHLTDEYHAETKPVKNLIMDGRSVYQATKAAEHLEDSDDVSLYVGMGHAPQIRDYFELEQSKDLSPATYQARNRDTTISFKRD